MALGSSKLSLFGVTFVDRVDEVLPGQWVRG
jgi:hypothetical protein